MQLKSWALGCTFATTLAATIDAHAQFTAFPYHYFEVRGPNSINSQVGSRVAVGAFGPAGMTGYATLDPGGNCIAGSCLTLNNQGTVSSPNEAIGVYFPPNTAGVYTGTWGLRLVAPGVVGTVAATTPALTGFRVLPFVSNNSIASSSDGRVHTFRWSGVPGVDSVRINVWDRSGMSGGQPARVLSSQNFVGSTTSFVIDLSNQPGASLYANDRPYTLEVSLIDTRDDNVADAQGGNLLSRSRTFFDFTLPSVPLTGEPVFLPIVEYVAGNPTYNFTMTVDGAGTFVIDPDIAVGYIYQTGAGNPNFRSVTLPRVGDGKYVVEVFDVGRGEYKPSPCASFTTDPSNAFPTSDTGQARLRYSERANRYVYKWKTPKTPGCYAFFLTLDSGQVFSANVMTTKGSGPDDRQDDDADTDDE